MSHPSRRLPALSAFVPALRAALLAALLGLGAQAAGAAEEVGGGVEGVGDAVAFGGGGHELHEAEGALGGFGVGVEGAFDLGDGLDQGRVEAGLAGGVFDVGA